MTPIISILQDYETEQWHLHATSYSVTEPAGPRLFRGGGLPDVKFCHDSEASAKKDAAKLQDYINAAWAGKAPKVRGVEEKTKRTFDITNAVWMT